MTEIIARVISQKGTCRFNHYVGQEFDVSTLNTKGVCGGLCPVLYHSVFPDIHAMQFGAKLPWALEDGSVHAVCPDPGSPVVVEIKCQE